MIIANEGAVLMRGDAIQLCAELTEIMVGMREKLPDIFVKETIKLAFDMDVEKDEGIKRMDEVFKDIPVMRTGNKEPNGLDAFFKAMDKVKGEIDNGF